MPPQRNFFFKLWVMVWWQWQKIDYLSVQGYIFSWEFIWKKNINEHFLSYFVMIKDLLIHFLLHHFIGGKY